MMARLIDADALMDVIRQHEYRLATKQGSIDYGMFTLGIQQAVDEEPTVDAVPVRHGHWIMNEDDELYCSVCGYIASLDSDEYFYRGKIRFDDSFYCPNCGAKMDEVSE